MTELQEFLLAVGVLGVIAAYAVANRYFRLTHTRSDYGRDDGQADVQYDDPYATIMSQPGKIDRMQKRFRDGGTIHFTPPQTEDFRTIKREAALTAPFGKRTTPPVKQPTIALSPRQTERVNIQRKLRGKPPLNRAGFKNAAAHAWDQPRRQPDNSSDWLTYFIMYECLLSDHQAHTCAGAGSLIIDPNLPYNGQGGEFAGAGASGNWTDPVALGLGYTETGSASDGPYNVQDPGPIPIPGGDGGYPSSSPSDSGSSGGGGD